MQGLPDVIYGLMTFSSLITYKSVVEALICEGCNHVVCVTSEDFVITVMFTVRLAWLQEKLQKRCLTTCGALMTSKSRSNPHGEARAGKYYCFC